MTGAARSISMTNLTEQRERDICALICRSGGIRAKEIAGKLNLDRRAVNHILYSSPLMKELCWQDREFRWHGIMKQSRPHIGLQEFAGYYDTAENFLSLSETEWMENAVDAPVQEDSQPVFREFLPGQQGTDPRSLSGPEEHGRRQMPDLGARI